MLFLLLPFLFEALLIPIDSSYWVFLPTVVLDISLFMRGRDL